MDSISGKTATKRSHWKGFGVRKTAFSYPDMERDCRIFAIQLPKPKPHFESLITKCQYWRSFLYWLFS